MASRADHFRSAEYLIGKARRGEDAEGMSRDQQIAAALVHATLAAAGPGVEAEVVAHEKAAAQAVGAAESSGTDWPTRLLGEPYEQALARAEGARVEETAGTVRPRPPVDCLCYGVAFRHPRGTSECAWSKS